MLNRFPQFLVEGRAAAGTAVAAAFLAAGCTTGNLPRISDEAVISVWRVMPGPGLRTGARLIAADLTADRERFLCFYRHARRVGVCDAVELERAYQARGLLIVQFSEAGRVVAELHVLKGSDGRPLTVGHGPLEVFAREPASPEYRYRRSDVEALAEWLKAQPPERDAGARRWPWRKRE